jgi:FtsH-binding integral membrane protein
MSLLVQATLAAMVFISALGCHAHVMYGIGGGWSGLIAVGLLLWLNFTDQRDEQKRLAILAGFSVFEGLSVGPLVDHSLHLNPGIVVTAFLGSTAIFACFTAASLFSKKRSLLYLGGILSSAVGVMLILSLVNIFLFRSAMVFYAELYIGLLVFSVYVAFDTQCIVARAEDGDRDYIMHAQSLFVDFVQLFVRLLVILNDKEERKKRRDD